MRRLEKWLAAFGSVSAATVLPLSTWTPRTWFRGHLVTIHRQGVIRFLESWGPRASGEVLDVGAGTWTVPREQFGRTARYISTDFVPRENIDIVCDVTNLKATFGLDRFDFVLCLEVLEHVKEPAAAIANMREVLKPGGTLLLTTPFNYRLHAVELGDYYRYTGAALAHLLREFTDVRIAPWGPAKFPFGYHTSARKPLNGEVTSVVTL